MSSFLCHAFDLGLLWSKVPKYGECLVFVLGTRLAIAGCSRKQKFERRSNAARRLNSGLSVFSKPTGELYTLLASFLGPYKESLDFVVLPGGWRTEL